MLERAERLLPGAVLLGFVVAAVLVSLLIRDAQGRAVDGLEESLVAEVSALADSQNAQYASQLLGSRPVVEGLGLTGEPGSREDLDKLNELIELFGGQITNGIFLVDFQAVVTQGVQLGELEVGEVVPRPELVELMASEAFRSGQLPGRILPVGDGVTTDQQTLLFVIPLTAPSDAPASAESPPVVVGGLVLEDPVDITEEEQSGGLGAVRRGETGLYLLFDDRGSVVASNDPAYVTRSAESLELSEVLADDPGTVHRRDGRVVVDRELPAVGWRLVFTQDEEEFEEPLAGPLQTAGTVIVIALLAAGFVMTLVLIRRLRNAREEQARLAQVSAAQQELISIVSHELRTPVAGVLGFLETSLDHWDQMDDPQRRSAVARAAANARRLQAMARDVLDTQHLETGELVQVMGPVEIVAEVRDAVEAQQELDGERRFEVQVPDGPVWVSADADRLQQVLSNLLDNARKNAPVVAPVEIELRVVDGEAEVTVRDQGPGITDEARERIFDKFVRGRGESVTGTGLGLYISRQIIEAHGGRIWVESDPGQGATFKFRLPIATASGSETGAEPVAPAD
ncbi:MAG: sensor histidine kinase [Acidimicrobiia bacterium]